ncbi:hypothetical protein FSP39_014230 [Pinctada imbricata]|uniref:Uncharacterized protein n=1 Tax=Pinctada imbricata TaxID=66713 RepID=A0AA88YQX6_PINIB|nr:hypothetical protein FSP39_014230 [Pinctada imbricata]
MASSVNKTESHIEHSSPLSSKLTDEKEVSFHSVQFDDTPPAHRKGPIANRWINDPENMFAGVQRKRSARFFLSGIDNRSTKSGILSYIESKGVRVTHMILFNARTERSPLTAKINVPLQHASLIEPGRFWPKGVRCRRWLSNREWEEKCAQSDNYEARYRREDWDDVDDD